MKILITGAHSTGKTSLINEFVKQNKLYKLHVIKEVARDMIDSGFILGKHGDVDSYIYYINEQLRREIESERFDYDLLLADRSLIDGIAHPIVNNKQKYTSLPKEFVEMFDNIIHFQKSFYDVNIYIPPKFNIVNDGNRPIDEKYRKSIDEEIRFLLDKHLPFYYTLKGQTVNERYFELLEIIKLEKN